jgi:hypothetical protein
LLQGHGHDTDDKGRGDDKIAMLRFDDEGVGQELLVADVDTVVAVDVFIEERFELPDGKIGAVSHFWKPNVFPTGGIVAFDIF